LATVILAFTSIPNPDLVNPGHADKLWHFAGYGLLGLLSMRAAPNATLRVAALVLAAVSAFGAVDEWHQQFIPGRSQDRADWFADTLGASLGVILSAVVRPRREPRT
jgi:VanZ family protein